MIILIKNEVEKTNPNCRYLCHCCCFHDKRRCSLATKQSMADSWRLNSIDLAIQLFTVQRVAVYINLIFIFFFWGFCENNYLSVFECYYPCLFFLFFQLVYNVLEFFVFFFVLFCFFHVFPC